MSGFETIIVLVLFIIVLVVSSLQSAKVEFFSIEKIPKKNRDFNIINEEFLRVLFENIPLVRLVVRLLVENAMLAED